MDKLQWAQWFIDHGVAIFPVEPQSKRAVVKEWQRFCREALTDEEKKRYIEMISNGYNYAVPGGQNNLVILDFEDRELLKAWIGEEEIAKICSKTLCVDTPHGGLHVYLIADDVPPRKFNPVFVKENKGIADLQSFNSYVLGPGSNINHRQCGSDKCTFQGRDYITQYSIYTNNEIGKVDLRGLLKFLADKGKKIGIELSSSARAWLFGEKSEEETKESEDLEKLKKELIKRDSGKPIEKVKEEICGKEKSKLVREVICQGKTYAEIEIDRSRGDWRLIIYLMRHGVTDPNKILQLLPGDSKAKENEKWDTEKYFTHTLEKAWTIAKKHLEAKKVAKHDKAKARLLLIEAVAEEIMNEHMIATFTGQDKLKEWHYGPFMFNSKKGIFVPIDVSIEAIINRKLRAYTKFPFGSDKTKILTDIKNEIMRRTLQPMPRDNMRIAFKNGTLEWDEGGDSTVTWYEANQRSYKEHSFHFIDWNLKIEEINKFNAKQIAVEEIEQLAQRLCPKSLEAFKTTVDDKWILLFEVIGYTLYPKYRFNKAILLTGGGSNGKSTFLTLLRKILGDDNVSAISLKRIMDGDKFASIELYHKLANFSSELFQFSVTNTDLFKKLTGEDYVEGQKKFKDPIYFINYAKLINSTNELPVVKDQSYGFWRRWIVIEFPHQFEIDPQFFKQTFTDEEIEGVIAVSVLAFSRVLEQKKFDFEGSSVDIKEKWERASDTVYAFVKDMIENGRAEYDPKNGDLYTPVKVFYQAYTQWCNENDKKPEGQANVTKRLETKFRVTKSQKRFNNGERMWCYVGIKLNSEGTGGHEEGETSDEEINDIASLCKNYDGKQWNAFMSYDKVIDECIKKGYLVRDEHDILKLKGVTSGEDSLAEAYKELKGKQFTLREFYLILGQEIADAILKWAEERGLVQRKIVDGNEYIEFL